MCWAGSAGHGAWPAEIERYVLLTVYFIRKNGAKLILDADKTLRFPVAKPASETLKKIGKFGISSYIL